MNGTAEAIDEKLGTKEEQDQWAASLSPTRMEALTDGTFSIAMTILVLEISVPHLLGSSTPGENPTSFLEMWGEFYIYVLGFIALAYMIVVTARGRHRPVSGQIESKKQT